MAESALQESSVQMQTSTVKGSQVAELLGK